MALVDCRTCNNPVDIRAKVCHYCGAENPGESVKTMVSSLFDIVKLGIGFIVLAIVIGIIGSTCDSLFF